MSELTVDSLTIPGSSSVTPPVQILNYNDTQTIADVFCNSSPGIGNATFRTAFGAGNLIQMPAVMTNTGQPLDTLGTAQIKIVTGIYSVNLVANTAGTFTFTTSGAATFTSASTWFVYGLTLKTGGTLTFTFELAARDPSSSTQCTIDYIANITATTNVRVLAIGY